MPAIALELPLFGGLRCRPESPAEIPRSPVPPPSGDLREGRATFSRRSRSHPDGSPPSRTNPRRNVRPRREGWGRRTRPTPPAGRSPPCSRRPRAPFLGRRPCRRLGARERGQSTVELAIVLPLIALAIFGCLKVGIAFFSYQQVASAANRGSARRGRQPRLRSDGRGARGREVDLSHRGIVRRADRRQLRLDGISAGAAWSYPGTVTVEITYPVTFSFLGQLPQVFNLKATATKRLER